jgi:hypothetical protein
MRRRRDHGLITPTGFAAIGLLVLALVAMAMLMWGG